MTADPDPAGEPGGDVADGDVVVDVMLPAYGDGPLLRETIASVLAQDDPGWRLTVVDDDAARDTELAGYLAGLADPRVRYVANPVRLGINRNFQRCAELATAELVMVFGADDRMRPDLVRRLRALWAEHPDVVMIHTDADVIDADGRPALPLADRVKRLTAMRVRGTRVTGGEELATSLLHGNWMYFPSCVFRRGPLQAHGFRPGYDVVLDLDLYLRLLLDGGRVLLLGEPGISYRRHATSVSSAGAGDGTRFAEETAFFAEAAGWADDAGWPRAARAARAHWTARLHALVRLPVLVRGGHHATARATARLALVSGWTTERGHDAVNHA